MKRETLAAKAVRFFDEWGRIPDLGQRYDSSGYHPLGSVDIHVFADGSMAAHWPDGEFSEAEVYETEGAAE